MTIDAVQKNRRKISHIPAQSRAAPAGYPAEEFKNFVSSCEDFKNFQREFLSAYDLDRAQLVRGRLIARSEPYFTRDQRTLKSAVQTEN